jgi:hypothetical protein
MKRLGINSKSKRFKAGQSKKHKISSEDHPSGNCGNVGCKKCFPDLYLLTNSYRRKSNNLSGQN